MLFLLVPALALTFATFFVALVWRWIQDLRGRKSPGFFKRLLAWHGALLLVHLFVTVPGVLGWAGGRFLVNTRGDEQAWRGPRLDPDGNWKIQTRDTLARERAAAAAAAEAAPTSLEAALDVDAAKRAVFFESSDGVKLRGFLVPPRGELATAPRFVAVLVHGLYRGGLELETVGSWLRDLGGEVLLLELRNHGGSGRTRPTYGLNEALDVRAAVDFLRARPEASGRPLVIFAVSLGTAAVALAAPDIKDLSGLILDAPIDDLRETAKRMLEGGGGGRRGPGFPQPFRSIILWAAEYLGGVPFDEVRPRESLRRLPRELPVLMIGAGHDFRCPPENVRALFDSLPTQPDKKKLWIVPEAEHGQVWVVKGEEYREQLAAFVGAIGRP